MKVTVTGQTTFVKRVTVGTPVRNVSEAATGVVSGSGRLAGNILVNDANSNLYEPATLQGGHMIVASHDPVTNDINLSIDSSEINSFLDSALSARIGGPFVDSAYVEQNSIDSERGLNLFNNELGQLTVSIVPNVDSSIDLGSASKKFRSLFLSGQTITLGGLTISDESTKFVVRDSANAVVSIDLGGNTTSDLAEGDNLYYTRNRFDSALGDDTSISTIRGYLNVVDAGGDGSFAYDSATGKLTYTGPSASEVRAHFTGGHGVTLSGGNIAVDSSEVRGLFSASGDLTYNSSTGEFSFDVEQVYTKANFDSDLGDANTGQLPEGSNLYYTDARVTAHVDSAYVQARQQLVDSASIIALVDSDYIQARQQLVDSASIIALVDSNYIADRIGGPFIDSDYFDTNIPKLGTDYVDSAEVEDLISNKIEATLFPHDSNLKAFIDVFTLPTSDGNAAQALTTNGSGTIQFATLGGVSDSASTIALIDSAYVRARVRTNQDLRTTDSVTFSGLTVSGDATVAGNAVIDGNLTVNGDTVTVTSTTLSVNDPLIHLADSNETSDTLDIGFIGHYYRDAQRRHAGLFRDATNDQFYLFRHMVDSSFDSSVPPSVIDRTATDFTTADLNVGSLIADSATVTNITRAATVDSGSYGSSSIVPVITVNASGFIDSIGTAEIAGSISSLSWDSSLGKLSVTDGGGTYTATIRGFEDNVSLNFGTSDDATIIRNPTNLVIKDSTGGIYIEAQDIYLASKNNGNPVWVQAGADDGVILSDSSGTDRLRTDRYGISMVGKLRGDSAEFTRTNLNTTSLGGIMTVSGGRIILNDGIANRISMGTGEEGNIYHSGNNSYFVTSGGANVIGAVTNYITDASLNVVATFNSTSDTILTHNQVEKFKTTSTGVQVTSADDGSSAEPELILYRNSASPADGDYLGQIQFKGKHDGGGDEIYAKVTGKIKDATSGTEDGLIETAIKGAGSFTIVSRQNADEFQLLNSTGLSVDGNTTLSGNLTYDGSIVDSDWVAERARVITHPEFKLIDVDAGAGKGPTLILDRNSSSPADSDDLGYIEFRGRNDADSDIEYASIRAHIQDATADTEDGELQFHLKQAGFDREKFALTPRGFELAVNERLYFQGDSGDLYLHADPTSSHNLLLPDSSGTLLTRDFVFELIDSAYIGARQGSTGLTLDFDDSAGTTKVQLTIVQAASIVSGSPIGFGNTVTLLDKDSAEVTISL